MIEVYPADALQYASQSVPEPGLVRWCWRAIRRGMDPDVRYLFEGTASTGHGSEHCTALPIEHAVFDDEVPLLCFHSWYWPIGVARLHRDAYAIRFEAELSPGCPGAAACWRGLVDGYCGCVSIGLDFSLYPSADAMRRYAPASSGCVAYRIGELSLCSQGANEFAIACRRWREPRPQRVVSFETKEA